MIVDSSVLIAILRNEPDAPDLSQAIEESPLCRISAANLFESAIVVDGSRDPILSRRLDALVAEAEMIVEPVTEEQVRIARAAYRDFGRGSGHRAGLNFGDCFAYALAKAMDEPLLYKGNDFGHTDIQPAITP